MRKPSRRAAVAASLVLALTAGATVAAVTRDQGGESSLIALNEPPLTDVATSAPSGSPTPTPSATPSPTQSPAEAAPASPAGTRPTASATTSAPTTAAPPPITNYGPRPPGSVTAPYRAGQTSWDLTSNGIRFRVSMTPAKAGEPMTWTVDTSSSVAGCCAIYLLFGDGFGARPDMDCDHPDPSVSYSHIYNRGGRKEFMVQAGHSKSCGASGDGSVYGAFDVAPGTSTAQGPSLPVVQFDTSTPVPGHANDHRYVSLWGEVDDADGYITKLVVSFGDGTSKTFPGDEGPCQRTPDGWPAASKAWLPYQPPPYHYYAKPGTYTLTLTAYSAGCDGRQAQSGSKSFTWTVPAPEPSETPEPSASAT